MMIVYAGNEFLTGDELALALVEYSRALATMGTAESVEVPIREADGSAGTAVFLVGPASQIVAKHVESDHELTDDAVLADLRARTARITKRNPGQFTDDWI